MKQKNFLDLIKVTQSIEINANSPPKKNSINPQIQFLTLSTHKNMLNNENQTIGTEEKSTKNKSPKDNSLKNSLNYSDQDLSDDSFHEGSIQKKVEMHLMEVKFPFPVISPFGYFTKVWNGMIIMILIYIITIFPVRLGFIDDDVDWIITDLIIDSIFMFDIFINTLTAYEDFDGILVFNLFQIVSNYLRGWFLFDFISSLPLYLMIEGTNFTQVTNMSNIYKVMKVLKLFRLIKMMSYYNKLLVNLKISKTTINISKLILFVLILLHITGCLWIMVAKIQDNPDTWIVHYELNDSEQFTVYISSIFYILTVLFTIGYGNITATTVTERAFTIVFMFLGIGCFGYVIGGLINAFSKNNVQNQIEQKEFFYTQLGQQLDIPKKTLEKILIRNMKLNVSKTITKIDAFSNQEIFKDLPFSLHKELYSFIYSEFLEKIEFFHDKPFSFLVKILSNLHPLFLKKGDDVFREGDQPNEIYFILKGRVVSRCIDKFESVKTVIFMEGSYFGETDIIMKRGRTESAYAETDVELWKLDRKDFIEALKAFKDIRKEVEKLVYEKVNARGSSSPTFKGVMKYLLPASYFISRISKSKKLLKSNIQNILRKSGKVLNELKVIGEKKDQYHDIRKLFLMDNSKKRKDKNEISECSIEQIEELGLKETVIFLKNQKIDILEEEFILMMKLPQQLQSFKDNLLRTTAHIDHPKIESMVKVLKFLNSVLKVQEEELVIEYKLLKKED